MFRFIFQKRVVPKQYFTGRLRSGWLGQANSRLGVWIAITVFAIALLAGCQTHDTAQPPDFYPWEGSWTYETLGRDHQWTEHRAIVAEKMAADGLMRYQISPVDPTGADARQQRNQAQQAGAIANLPWYAKQDGWVWQYETETAAPVKVAKYQFTPGETWTEPFDVPADDQHAYRKLEVQSVSERDGRLVASVTGRQYDPSYGWMQEIYRGYRDGVGLLGTSSGYPNDSEAFWTTTDLLEYRSGNGRVKYRR